MTFGGLQHMHITIRNSFNNNFITDNGSVVHWVASQLLRDNLGYKELHTCWWNIKNNFDCYSKHKVNWNHKHFKYDIHIIFDKKSINKSNDTIFCRSNYLPSALYLRVRWSSYPEHLKTFFWFYNRNLHYNSTHILYFQILYFELILYRIDWLTSKYQKT